ncbi:hypothetical protein Sjap_017167 [Stephania japonica]|uniref:Uncharacterized protein n=1 Tax=Stephania japonica TaxID=461633 RepID=A0AAP0I5N8_9MAGN
MGNRNHPCRGSSSRKEDDGVELSKPLKTVAEEWLRHAWFPLFFSFVENEALSSLLYSSTVDFLSFFLWWAFIRSDSGVIE